MESKSEMDALAERLSESLQLEVKGETMNMEQMVYTANPPQLEYLRQQVLKEQATSSFDDEDLVKKFLEAAKPKAANSAGDSSTYLSCFQNQIMMATTVTACDQMPGDLKTSWMCMVCPEGSRVLVVAAHRSTRVYDLEGTFICEHDTHLPGGSPSNISKVDEEECTILDCLYNDEQEVYYVLDVLCWKGTSFYKSETSVRITAVLEKMKDIPTMKQVSQSNPFRFFTVPVSFVCHEKAICSTISRASFSITGLLFYHKKALYLPGLTPLGVWLEVGFIPSVLDIEVHRLDLDYGYGEEGVQSRGRRDWKRNRYEMWPEQCHSVHNSAYVSHPHRNWMQQDCYATGRGGYSPQWGPYPSYAAMPYGYEDLNYQQPYYPYAQPYYQHRVRQKNGKGKKSAKSDKNKNENETTKTTQDTSAEKTETSEGTEISEKDVGSEADTSTDSEKAVLKDGSAKSGTDTLHGVTAKSDTVGSLDDSVKSDISVSLDKTAKSLDDTADSGISASPDPISKSAGSKARKNRRKQVQ